MARRRRPMLGYPESPGHRGVDTSVQAAEQVNESVEIIRTQVMNALQVRSMTPEEIADFTGIHFLNIRPRCTELRYTGHIRRTGRRRMNRTGGAAHELEVCPRYRRRRRRSRR